MAKVSKIMLRPTWRRRGQFGSHVGLYAYLAGFFDGEGHLISYRSPKQDYPYVRIGATNTDRQPIDILLREFGGRMRTRVRKKKGTKKNHKRQFDWVASGKDAHYALSKMLPWLLVKRNKAQAAITILQNSPGVGRKPLIQEIVAVRLAVRILPTKVYRDNPKRHKLKCIMCGAVYYRTHVRGQTCSRKCSRDFFWTRHTKAGPVTKRLTQRAK